MEKDFNPKIYTDADGRQYYYDDRGKKHVILPDDYVPPPFTETEPFGSKFD